MLKLLFASLLLLNLQTVHASKPLDSYRWEALADGESISLTQEDVPYTKAKLFYMDSTYIGEKAALQHGISSPVGGPIDRDFIGDIMAELTPLFATYQSGLASADFQWKPLVLLEGGAGCGYFAMRFRQSFLDHFPIAKDAHQPPFMTYILNEPFQDFQQALDGAFPQKPRDILKFVRNSKNIEEHLYNPNNKFQYNFVVMNKVAHFWNPREFAMVFSKLHEKLTLGGKIYLTLDSPDLISPQSPYMQDYIRAHIRGDLCPGYFPGKIFNAMHDIDAIFRGEAPDDPEGLLKTFITFYNKTGSVYVNFKETLFEVEAIKTSLNRLSFDVNEPKSFNYICIYSNGLRGTQTCVIATKTSETPDFSELLAQADQEKKRKNPALNTKNLLKALPYFEGYCNELDEMARRINLCLK